MKINEYETNISAIKTYKNTIFVGLINGTIISSEFQYSAQEKEFDTLESTDILEHIKDFCFLDFGTFHYNILSCNDKNIKLHSLRENKPAIDYLNCTSKQEYISKLKYTLPPVHNYNIENLSYSNEYLISSDYLRINMWNIRKLNIFYNLIDIKPKNIDEIDEVITKCKLYNNLFTYSTSNGILFINDLRISLKNNNSIKYCLPKSSNSYEDVLRIISDYLIYDNQVVVRDLDSIYFYDLRNDKLINQYTLENVSWKQLDTEDYNSNRNEHNIDRLNSTFYTGGQDGCIYKADSINLEKIKLEIDDEIVLVKVADENIYYVIENELYLMDENLQ